MTSRHERKHDGKDDGHGCHDGALHGNGLDGRIAALLLDGAIDAKAHGEVDCQPREASVTDREVQDADATERDGNPLQGRKALFEYDETQ